MAADADPEQKAQCDEACLGEYGKGNAGVEPDNAVALRFAEHKALNPGGGVADAYAATGANKCTVKVTNTTPTRKRDLIARHCTASLSLHLCNFVRLCPPSP